LLEAVDVAAGEIGGLLDDPVATDSPAEGAELSVQPFELGCGMTVGNSLRRILLSSLEGSAVTAKTQLHLDRCLTCRACETTCPSGVRYGRLVDIGRHLVEERVPRPAQDRAWRWLLRKKRP